MEKPVLSVCIPTYNRGEFLDKTIESVVKQIKELGLNNQVEICISDNASTDNTEEVVNRWLNEKDIRIVYHKNQTNLGADRNFIKVIDIANGEYCWFLGSDDIAKEDSISIILNHIENKQFDIFLYDRLNFVSDLSKSRLESWKNGEFEISKNNLKEYISYLDKLGGLFSYISVIVFKKDKWMEIIKTKKEEIEKFIGTQYIHSYILLSMIEAGSFMKYTNVPIVYNRLGNSVFLEKRNHFKRIKLDYNYLPIARSIFGREIEEAIKELLKRKNTIPKLLRAKYFLESAEQDEFYRFLTDYELVKNPLIIKLFPNPLIKLMLTIYAQMKKQRT
ncbi:glycosyltransferase family 2 protein [Persephonella sp.]